MAVGFDRRAYDQGARVIQAVAAGMGGASTWSASSATCRFRRWLYQSSGAQAAAPSLSAWDWLHEVDVALPAGSSDRQR